MARQWTGTPYQGPDGIWHFGWTDTASGESGEELSYEGPTGTTQPQPASPFPPGYDPSVAHPVPTQGPSPAGAQAWWNAPSNPWSIGAGTSEQGYGWGVPGFGQDPIKILTEYLPYLKSMTTGQQGGYIPGSGTLNQFRLDQPGLLTTILGQQVNARYGQGGTGDPTTGREPQTPEEWLSGPKAFDWQYNMGQTPETKGLDYIANLFGRPDAGTSGISTAAWSAPQQYWAGLADAVQRGVVKASAFGLKALASKGFNVSPPGGPANLGGGAGGAGGQGGQGGVEGAYASIIAMQQAQVAAQITFSEWQMRSGDEKLAMEKATEAFRQKFAEVQQAFTEKTTAAGMTGMWDGQETLARQQQMWNQGFQRDQFTEQQRQNEAGNALNLLSQQSALQGPRDVFRYHQMNASTPGGLKDMLAGLAGRYNFAGSGFQGTPGPATLQSRTQDLLAGGQQGAGGAGQDGQSQFALPSPNQINLANWSRLSPSGQQTALGAYESQGYYGADVEEALRRAAPRYVSPGAPATVGL